MATAVKRRPAAKRSAENNSLQGEVSELVTDQAGQRALAAPTQQEIQTAGAALTHGGGAMQSGILEVISRAAADPTVDVVKLEKLLDMAERIHAREAEQEFNRAMAVAQSNMTPVRTDAENKQTRSRYATYAALDRAVRPAYSQNGFALSFDTKPSSRGEEWIGIICQVTHSGGHSRMYSIDIPTDGKGLQGNSNMTKTHATGAGVSYGARYLLRLIWNIAVGEDDTDGNMPSAVNVEEWIAAATKAQTLTELADVRDRGLRVLEEKGLYAQVKAFKSAVLARKDVLDKRAGATDIASKAAE